MEKNSKKSTNKMKEDTKMPNKETFTPVKGEEELAFIQNMLKDYHILPCNNDTIVMTVPVEDNWLRLIVGSQKLKDYISMQFFERANRFPSKKTLGEIESWLRYKTMTQDPKDVSYRVKRIGGTIYYDLCTNTLQYIKITKDGWEVSEGDIDYFAYSPSASPQVIPIHNGGDIERLRKYINISDEDWLLFVVYLISCFYEGIQHPVLNINGVWGSGKSTVSKIVKSLVDPAPVNQLLNDLPRQDRDLIVTLTSSYYIAFDNLSKINAEKSDIICKAVTGGNASFRELYTNSGLKNLSYNTLIAFNGISDVIRKGDLAQRTLYFESLVIDEDKRLPDNEFWESFNKDKPYILGGIFDILSKAIGLYDTIKVQNLHRLADFHKWGCAIAKAINPDLEVAFSEALIRNKMKQVNNTLDNNVMLTAMFAWLEEKHYNFYDGSVKELYLEVRDFIEDDYRNQYNIKYFPNAANSFGGKLRGYVQLCKELGWDVDFYKDSTTGNSHVRISKLRNTENIDVSTIKRSAIFTRIPILSGKKAKVFRAAENYILNKN